MRSFRAGLLSSSVIARCALAAVAPPPHSGRALLAGPALPLMYPFSPTLCRPWKRTQAPVRGGERPFSKLVARWLTKPFHQHWCGFGACQVAPTARWVDGQGGGMRGAQPPTDIVMVLQPGCWGYVAAYQDAREALAEERLAPAWIAGCGLCGLCAASIVCLGNVTAHRRSPSASGRLPAAPPACRRPANHFHSPACRGSLLPRDAHRSGCHWSFS